MKHEQRYTEVGRLLGENLIQPRCQVSCSSVTRHTAQQCTTEGTSPTQTLPFWVSGVLSHSQPKSAPSQLTGCLDQSNLRTKEEQKGLSFRVTPRYGVVTVKKL